MESSRFTAEGSAAQVPQAEPQRAFADAKVPLFTPSQIGAGAFFGTLVASGWLARANFIALGDKKKGDLALLLGVVVTIGLMTLAFVLPAEVPSAIFTVPQVVLALQLAKKEFEARMLHADRISSWKVGGICLASLVLVVTTVIGVAVGLSAAGLMSLE